MSKLSNNETPGSSSEDFRIRNRIFGEKKFIMFLLPNLMR